jgi:predicted metal-dependent HD superfamily phosphohydrolase/phosphopantetheine adenylyltransferase
MDKIGFLNWEVSDSNLGLLISAIKAAKDSVSKRILCELNLSACQRNNLSYVQNLLTLLYIETYKVLTPEVFFLLPQFFSQPSPLLTNPKIDIVFKVSGFPSHIDIACFNMQREMEGLRTLRLVELSLPEASHVSVQADFVEIPRFTHGVLGGTFDYLHPGHLLLLTTAALVTTASLGIGISRQSLLERKVHKECLQPFSWRANRVKKFMTSLNPSLLIDLFGINDPIGPAGTNPDYEVLILTEEVAAASQLINNERTTKGLKPLEVVVIRLIEINQSKISSTEIRKAYSELGKEHGLNLLEEWVHLCQRIGVREELTWIWWSILSNSYSRSGRYYHNLSHISTLLYHTKRLSKDSPLLLLSIWFHDLVYDPRASHASNEAQSKEMLLTFVKESTLGEDFMKAGEYIMGTVNHKPVTEDPDELDLLDLDLSILGSSRSLYDNYVLAIRKEYSHIPDTEFIPARRAVLSSFLNRDQLYFTDTARQDWEAAARANLEREIEGL